MTTVQSILDVLKDLAPPEFKEPWDNVGLLCGRMDRPVDRVMVALDPFLHVAREASEYGAQLLVTHHPLLFSAKSVTDQDPIGQTLLFLIEHHMSLICMHTNLDATPGGVNDCLAAALGLEHPAVLEPAGTDRQGRAYGLGRYGTVAEQSLEAFADLVKARLHCEGLRYASAGKPVRKVGVCGGSGSDYVAAAKALGCDTFVTGDVKYNGFWDAVDLGVNLIDAGHFPTENVVCPWLLDQIRGAFPELSCKIAEGHGDVIRFC